MKILFFIVTFISLITFAEENGLPFESDLTRLKLNKISRGTELILDFHLSVPETQKVNPAAPSHVTVFERAKGSKLWSPTKRFSLQGFSSLFSVYNKLETIQLKSADSEVAVHATVYHCGKKDTKIPCFIQGFQGFAVRDSHLKNKNIVPFNVKAFVY